jgi:hypothetical protein
MWLPQHLRVLHALECEWDTVVGPLAVLLVVFPFPLFEALLDCLNKPLIVLEEGLHVIFLLSEDILVDVLPIVHELDLIV